MSRRERCMASVGRSALFRHKMKLHFTILDNVLFAILQSVKRFEQSKGLDTALYKNYIFTENMLDLTRFNKIAI